MTTTTSVNKLDSILESKIDPLWVQPRSAVFFIPSMYCAKVLAAVGLKYPETQAVFKMLPALTPHSIKKCCSELDSGPSA